MAHVFLRDEANERKLVASIDPNYTLRGFIHDEGDGRRVVIPIEWGQSPTASGKPDVVCMSARLWPGGAKLVDIVRPWRRAGDWRASWDDVRRQVREVTGIDIGHAPSGGA